MANTPNVFQQCLTLCDPLDCRLPGSSVCGVFQARILESVSALLQGIFPTQGSNSHLLHWQADSCHWFTQEALSEYPYKKENTKEKGYRKETLGRSDYFTIKISVFISIHDFLPPNLAKNDLLLVLYYTTSFSDWIFSVEEAVKWNIDPSHRIFWPMRK